MFACVFVRLFIANVCTKTQCDYKDTKKNANMQIYE